MVRPHTALPVLPYRTPTEGRDNGLPLPGPHGTTAPRGHALEEKRLAAVCSWTAQA